MSKSPIQVRDLKLEALTKFAHNDWGFPDTKNPKLLPVVKSLRANAVRTRLLILLPSQIAWAMALTERVHAIAEYDLTGKISREGLSGKIEESVNALREEMLEAHRQAHDLKSGTPEGDKEAGEFHLQGAKSLLGLAENPMGAMMLLPSFSAHISSAWTTIETMLGDLWEAALNCHPATLATLNGKPRRIGGEQIKAPENQKITNQNEQKSVPLSLIELHKFDLRESMGTVFRRQRRFEFTRLSAIREAYSCAFSVKSSKIDTALSNKSFDALSVVRNLIVHKGGYADAEYVKHCAHLKQIPKTDLGLPIHLDGQIVADLIGDAFASAKSLFIAVDDWIEQN